MGHLPDTNNRHEPYPSDTPLLGPGSPGVEHIDGLIKYLNTVRERFGNTTVSFSLKWGSSALWAEDALNKKVKWYKSRLKNLKDKGKKVKT